MRAHSFAWWSALVYAGLCWMSPTPMAAEQVRLLVVHGGHEFETNQFLQVFRDNTNVTFEVAQHPAAHARWQAEPAKEWDVLVLYDFWQEIGDEAKADLVARLKEGKGLVVLHHALANYQKWPEFERIVGGKFYLEKQTVNNVEKPQSTYKHDVEFTVRIANNQHPVTQGLTNFVIHDEVYGGFDVSSQTHALLTTEEPASGKTIAWAKTYEAARVVYIQLGHDHLAYENPSFRRLVANAIRWVAKRD
ncbi:MAG TPA: ThuA domain-containing protein [Verrucomicrobiota bacterium]|nr:ThuA domain-containing protein [Verrucomicrobiota bacterium]HOA60367.1 ThuA domain-containing protein [Verrucomicrobiota bacterium]HOF46901.1 ThuA domain-containing protein [Verrucomicrobiota bacterium]HOR69843.1 ThuA domain-containing protein [Verrucomicrobiota bacterium]HOU86334.1 ThuA domain-containing protein [Verrucomicrobiota bacterium]